MRIAVLGAGVCGLVAAHRLARAGHAVDVYERWPGLGGQAATLDVGDGHRLERYYHHLFTSDRHIAALYAELGMPDAIEWRPSSVAFFARGALHPFVTPLDLLRFRPLPPLARVRHRRRRARAAALRAATRAPYERRDGARVDRALDGPRGVGRGLGAAAAREVRRRAPTTSRWSGCGASCGCAARCAARTSGRSGSATRASSWEPLFDALARSVEAARRARADRPPGAPASRAPATGFAVRAGAPGSFRSGHDPRAFDARRRAERYDRVLATVPERRLRAAARPGARRRRWGRTTSAACAASSTSPRSASCSSSTARSARTTGPTSPTARCPFVGLIEHTNFIEPERYGGRRFLYVANYLAARPRAARARRRRAARPLRAGPARGQPGLRRATGSGAAWLLAEPAAQPIVTVGYARAHPAAAHAGAGLVLANTTQVYPEDRGTNYAVRLGGEAAQALLEG